MSADREDDVLGLAGTYPRPGWVVIDAIRDRAFTGEVVFATTPAVTVHADRGRIYIAERSGDPALSVRLVSAEALTAGELEQGVIRLAGADHLGRLFERAPSVDRAAVLAANDLMTDDCLGWLAAQRVHGADVTPYRHHASGVHRWENVDESSPATISEPPAFAPPATGAPVSELAPPVAPLSAPDPTGATVPVLAPPPVFAAPPRAATPVPSLSPPAPTPVRAVVEPAETEDVIRWDEPAFLDRPLAGDSGFGLGLIRPLPTSSRPIDPAHTSLDPADEPLFNARFDWLEDLDEPVARSQPAPDPLARPTKLPSIPADPAGRFEVIWPSGEIDEQFGGLPADALPHPDIDRAGPTARLARSGPARGATALRSTDGMVDGIDGVDAVDDAMADALGAGVDDIEVWLASETEHDTRADDVVLAVRRAVAEIETGSLGRRERRIGPRGLTLGNLDQQLDLRAEGDANALVPPGRVALKGDTGEIPLTATGRMSRPNPSAGSVFDEVPPALPAPSSTADAADAEGEGVERVSALRRLIGSLRRR